MTVSKSAHLSFFMLFTSSIVEARESLEEVCISVRAMARVRLAVPPCCRGCCCCCCCCCAAAAARCCSRFGEPVRTEGGVDAASRWWLYGGGVLAGLLESSGVSRHEMLLLMKCGGLALETLMAQREQRSRS